MHCKRGELGRRLTVRPLPTPFSQLLPKGAEIKAKDAGSGRYTPVKRKPVAKAQGTDQPDKNAPGRRKDAHLEQPEEPEAAGGRVGQ